MRAGPTYHDHEKVPKLRRESAQEHAQRPQKAGRGEERLLGHAISDKSAELPRCEFEPYIHYVSEVSADRDRSGTVNVLAVCKLSWNHAEQGHGL